MPLKISYEQNKNIIVKRKQSNNPAECLHTVLIRYRNRRELDAAINFLISERSLFPDSSAHEYAKAIRKLPVIR